MNTMTASGLHPDETGSLWTWANKSPKNAVSPYPFHLFMEIRPLVIRLSILGCVVGAASFLPHIEKKSPEISLVQTSAGLQDTSTVEMAQLIMEPVRSGQEKSANQTGRTGRHPVPDFQFTRFSNSWIKFQF